MAKHPKCPECKVEITELNFDVTASCSAQLTQEEVEKIIDINGNEVYSDLDYDIDCLTENVEFDNFSCPECSEILFYNEDDAREFLKNLTPLQKLVKEKIRNGN